MNKTGKMVIPYAYQTAGDFSDGKVVVSKNDNMESSIKLVKPQCLLNPIG